MSEEIKTCEEIFSNLIGESENIVIEYTDKHTYFKEDAFISFIIRNVNGCLTKSSFRNKIRALSKESIITLQNELSKLDKEGKIELLEDCSEQIGWLKDIVVDKREVLEETEWGPAEVFNFKAFSNAKFNGPQDDKLERYELSILRKSSEFAITWVEAIEETKQKIDFLINQTELLPDKIVMKNKNEKYIFYSWQSDRDEIRKHIWLALHKVKSDFKKDGVVFHIDSDMRNSPGGQDIPTTLFGKIEKADVFIADVILTGVNSLKDAEKPEKKSSNPNVLIELGFAAGKLGWEKVIMILNTDTDRIEDLPFDIRNRSILWYNSATPELLRNKLIDYITTIIKES